MYEDLLSLVIFLETPDDTPGCLTPEQRRQAAALQLRLIMRRHGIEASEAPQTQTIGQILATNHT